MALLGQASGGFTESSSALRILHVGIRNTVGQLTADAFTQSNPAFGAAAGQTQAPGLLTNVLGVLSGSVAFARGTTNEHGGVGSAVAPAGASILGVFINNASGNAFENQPGVASNRGPYVSAQGTFANLLYETRNATDGTALNVAYTPGVALHASLNGFLTTFEGNVNHDHPISTAGEALLAGAPASGIGAIGILKIAPDSTSDELVYDQRI
jgi:hypothetical protein